MLALCAWKFISSGQRPRPGTMSDPVLIPPSDSVRSFLKRSKLGRYNEEEQAQREAETSQRLSEEKAQAGAIPLGSRCEVWAPGQPPRRGTVMYVGMWPTKTLYSLLRWAVLGTQPSRRSQSNRGDRPSSQSDGTERSQDGWEAEME